DGLRPASAAVCGDHDLGDAPGTGIGDTGDLVDAGLLQNHAVRGTGDKGLDLLQEVEAVGFAVRKNLRVGLRLVDAHRRLLGEHDPAQVFHVHVAFIAGQP